MKIIITSVLILLSFTSLYSQEIYRASEGQWTKVEVDTITQLNDLIAKLKLPWELVETGKGYWIGYTDDMYSIAQHKNNALPALSQLLENSEPIHTRLGAVYTTHLIGINSEIAGRHKENFIDTIARIQILKQLKDPELHETIISLLMRDPWTLDIEYLMNYLNTPNFNYSYVLSALKRYKFENRPIGQKIPDSILSKKVSIELIDSTTMTSENMFKALELVMGERIIIDSTIRNTHNHILSNELTNLETKVYSEYFLDRVILILTNEDFIYSRFDSRYFVAFKDGNILIFGPSKAREIWIEWWNKKNNGS